MSSVQPEDRKRFDARGAKLKEGREGRGRHSKGNAVEPDSKGYKGCTNY